jgi:hypothetical protein
MGGPGQREWDDDSDEGERDDGPSHDHSLT